MDAELTLSTPQRWQFFQSEIDLQRDLAQASFTAYIEWAEPEQGD
jgi:hypothetical protein